MKQSIPNLGASAALARCGGLVRSYQLLVAALLWFVTTAQELPVPVAHFPLDGNASDVSGRGHHGTASNTGVTTNRFGTPDSALVFNGTNSAVVIPYAGDFDVPPAGEFTISAWVRPDRFIAGVQAVFVKGDFSWDYGINLSNETQPRFFAGRDFKHEVQSAVLSATGAWYHVAATYSNRTWQLYVNGSLDATKSAAAEVLQSADGVALGRKGVALSDFFKGAIDDVRFYRTVLNPSQILTLATQGERPEFRQAPPARVDAVVGDPFTLSATVVGKAPLTYRWYFNDELIAGATSATLPIPAITPESAGTYRLVVSNSFGTNTASTAVRVFSYRPPVLVSLSPPPGTSDSAPLTQVRAVISNATHSVNLTSVELRFDGLPVAHTAGQEGALVEVGWTPSLLAPKSSHRVSLTYADDATPAGRFTNEWEFTVRDTVVLPEASGLFGVAGLRPGFSVRCVQAAAGSTALASSIDRAEAQLGTPPIPAAFFSDHEEVQLINYFDGWNGIASWGDFTAGASRPDRMLKDAGLISPTHNDYFAAEIVTWLELGAGPHRLGVNVDEGFRLYLGTNYTGADNVISSSAGSSSGSYQFECFVTRGGLYPFRLVWWEGAVAAHLEWFSIDLEDGTKRLINDTAYVRCIRAFVSPDTARAPRIVNQPQGLITREGSPFVLSVTAEGNPAPSFQWFHGQEPMPNATNATLTFNDPRKADSGTYAVRVTNSAGSVTSDPVQVTVYAAPPLPVAWWKADGNGKDEMGLHEAFPKGSFAYTAGVQGQAFDFFADGSNFGYLEVNDSSLFRIENELAVCFWAKRRSLDRDEPVFSRVNTFDSNNAHPVYSAYLVRGTFGNAIMLGGSSRWRSEGEALDLDWHHYAILARAGEAAPRFFVDGAERAAVPVAVTGPVQLEQPQKPGAVYLGTERPGVHASLMSTLMVDDVRVYDRLLDATQIVAIRSGAGAEPERTPRILPVASITAIPDAIANYPVSRLIDGDSPPYTALNDDWPNRVALFAGSAAQPAVLRLDLGAPKRVTDVAVSHFGGNGNGSLRSLKTEFSLDGVNYSPGEFAFAALTSYSTAEVLRPDVLARYVRIEVAPLPKINAALAEVSVRGFDVEPTKPVFAIEPADVTSATGVLLQIRPVVLGAVPISYQWLRGGQPLAGETNLVLTRAFPTLADSGGYRLVASNSLGAITSRVAQVTIATDIQPGAFDHSFNQFGGDNAGFLADPAALVNRVVRQGDGKLLVAGRPPSSGGYPPNGSLLRLLPDGIRDPSFSAAIPGGHFDNVALLPDGRIMVTGSGNYGPIRLNADGSRDGTFTAPEYLGDGSARPGPLLVQTDGHVVVGGRVGPSVAGLPRSNLVRFREDGGVDEAFSPQFNSATYALAADGEGNLLVAGAFTAVNGVTKTSVARLLPDGTLDPAFNPSPSLAAVSGIWALADGRILIREGGNYDQQLYGTNVRRLLANGAVDPSFAPAAGSFPGRNFGAVQPLPDGSALVYVSDHSTTARVCRLLENGQPDPAFDLAFSPAAYGALNELVLLPDGRLLVGGGFDMVNGELRRALARVQGLQLLPTWNIGFSSAAMSEFEPSARAIITLRRGGADTEEQAVFVETAGGTAVPGQDYDSVGEAVVFGPGETEKTVAIPLRDDQSVDGPRTVTLNLLAPEGVVLGGISTATLTIHDNERPAGSFNFSLAPDTTGTVGAFFQSPASAVTRLLVQDDGGLLVAGNLPFCGCYPPSGTLFRLFPNGSADPSFNLQLPVGGRFDQIALTGEGRIVMTGHGNYGPIRLNSDGSRDAAFVAPDSLGDSSARPVPLLVLADGRVLVGGAIGPTVGEFPRVNLVRFTATGEVDAGFAPTFSHPTLSVAADGEGRYLVGGAFLTVNGAAHPGLVRLSESGAVDSTFQPIALQHVDALWVQAGGRILLREGVDGSGVAGLRLRRLLPDGSEDPAFAFPASQFFGLTLTAQLPLPDGSIVVAASDGRLRRLEADGSVDFSFDVRAGPAGARINAIQRLPGGDLVIGGDFDTVNGFASPGLARLTAAPDSIAPPEITVQPKDAVTGETRNAVFSVTAGGGAPLFYQWQFSGTNLPGEVGPTLTVFSATALSEGDYRVLVRNPIGTVASRSVGLTVVPKPTNDTFAKRLVLGSADTVVQGHNFAATKDAGEPAHGGAGNRSVWYSWTAPSSTPAAARLTWNGPQRFALAVYRGTTLFALTAVGKATNASPASVRFTPAAGTTYQIAVDGLTANDEGAFQLEVGAAVQGDPPTIATQPVGGTFLIGQSIALGVGANSSAPMTFQWQRNEGNLVGANATSLNFPAARPDLGGNYRVIVANEFGAITSAVANVTINVQPPANDLFANAATLTGRIATAAGFNFAAGAEAGEPQHAGASAARSVWWKWTPPESGRVTVDTGGSEGDTRLAVYVGSNVSQLTPVAMDDNSGPAGSARAQFNATAGTAYFLAVDTNGDTEGAIALRLDLNPFPLVSLTAPVNGAKFRLPTNVVMVASASDDDGVAGVEFLADSVSLGVLNSRPFTFTWSNPPVGPHALTARATDGRGIMADSPAVTVTVEAPDEGPPVWTLSTAQITASEADGKVTLLVKKTGSAAASVTVTTVAAGAEPGRDFTLVTRTVSLAGQEREQTIVIPLLNEFVPDGPKQFRVKLDFPSAGSQLGDPAVAIVDINDDDGALANSSFLDFRPPETRPAALGLLQVLLDPAPAGGQWRLPWETTWHNGGEILGNLDPGEYPVEFRPVANYVEPEPATNSVAGGAPLVRSYSYHESPDRPAGVLSVNLAPLASLPAGVDAPGWRLRGESTFRASGSLAGPLPTGRHILEFKPVAGWTVPPAREVVMQAGTETALTVVYLQAGPLPVGVQLPEPLRNYLAIRNGLTSTTLRAPFALTGQLKTAAGFGSGIAVRSNVVLTAAHVLWDEGTLDFAGEIDWFHERHAGEYDPRPFRAAGFYVFEQYATERRRERNEQGLAPGVSGEGSRQWDVAAVYFHEPVARGGQSGYLLSDLDANQWLISPEQKTLIGYPLTGGVNDGRMHDVRGDNYLFARDVGRTFSSAEFLSYAGNSGGPLCISYTRPGDTVPIYFPAGVYLGTVAGRSVVRAIDSGVASLINRAASSAALGTNFVGGGVTGGGTTVSANPFALGGLMVRLTGAADGGWRLAGDPTKPFNTGGTRLALPPKAYALEFKPVVGLPTPPNLEVTVINRQDTVLDVRYGNLPPVERATIGAATLGPDGRLKFNVSGTTGATYVVETSTDLKSWTPVATNGVPSSFEAVVPAGANGAFYRAVNR